MLRCPDHSLMRFKTITKKAFTKQRLLPLSTMNSLVCTNKKISSTHPLVMLILQLGQEYQKGLVVLDAGWCHKALTDILQFFLIRRQLQNSSG